ncbi:uncharacterized protein LOC128248081 [Octopus bimaculoides]|uniref:uncharacterized protein LOC128248081 n=1 Tax=Octopus bimaculoides TaxID=37653 RepID=UPI0022E3B66D|nr:uncharacterized protein LOC128248081 [Octopus bimaculoides]
MSDHRNCADINCASLINSYQSSFKDQKMYIYSILLITALCVSGGPPTEDCSGCLYNGYCICNNAVGLVIEEYSCKQIACTNKEIDVQKIFCKDFRGNCMPHGKGWLGVYRNLCVTNYCYIVRGRPRLTMRYNQVCTQDHIVSDILQFIYPPVRQC